MQSCSQKILPNLNLTEEKGATLVEAAIGLGLFFTVIILGLEMLWLGYCSLGVQYAAITSAREMSLQPATTAGTRAQEFATNIRNRLGSIGIDGDRANICFSSTGAITQANCTAADVGSPGSLLVVRVAYPVRLLFQVIDLNVVGQIVTRNQRFQNNQGTV